MEKINSLPGNRLNDPCPYCKSRHCCSVLNDVWHSIESLKFKHASAEERARQEIESFKEIFEANQVLGKKVDDLKENLRLAQEVVDALDRITIFTAKGHKAFSDLVSGAQKIDSPDLINYASGEDALASLVYKTAEKAITAWRERG